MYLPRAIALLLLMGGCGGGEEERERETLPPETSARTAEAPAPAAEAPPAPETPPPPDSPPPEAEAPPPGSWQDCGRILSPIDRRPQRVEARVFDCRAARRVAVRYLRNRSLPEGWGPADCAASRAACEQGGWGFRLVDE